MTYEQEYLNTLEEAHRQQTATKIFDGIRKLYSNESSPRRWIWELLQNAKDVANYPNNRVKIEINLNKDYLEFKHNGKPFSMRNLTYLIEQVSTKERNRKKQQEIGKTRQRTTGKFGTGFLTTHLLSKTVELSSIFEDKSINIYKHFQLLLDRSATTVEEMIEDVKISSGIRQNLDDENKCPIINNYKIYQNCDTSFRYKLDEQGLLVANTGIKDLHTSIIYTLIFVPEIESVLVTDEVNHEQALYEIENTYEYGDIKIQKVSNYYCDKSKDKVQEIYIASLSKIISLSDEEGEVSIAIQLEKKDELYSVFKIQPELPILFCDFPLVGSEKKFTYPVIINSPLFEPTEPRDSVFLDDRNETGGKKNRAIVEATISLYEILLDYASSNLLNPHLLANSKLPDGVDENWYKLKVQDLIRAKILTSSIVSTSEYNGNKTIKLEDALIPFCKKSRLFKLWDLAIALHPNKIPQKKDIQDWYDIINDSGWSEKLKYDLPKLLRDISLEKTLNNLALRLSKSVESTLMWVNKIIEFISESKQIEILNEYAILPNQDGNFRIRKEVAKDENIPEGLKDVLYILGENWKEELLHTEIICDLDKIRNIGNISDRISAIITEKENKNIRIAAYLLISYIPDIQKRPLKKNTLEKRNQVWQFAKAIDINVPEQKILSDWTLSLWDICDDWVLKTLIEDIKNLKNIDNLQVRISQETQSETVLWLSSFMAFLSQQNKSYFYSDEAIFPNQKGVFKKKSELLFDENIPEQVKDVLEKFGKFYRDTLLHENILGFDKIIDHLTTTDISKIINEIIREKSTNQSQGFTTEFKSGIYTLVSFFTGVEENDRRDIWKFAHAIYGDQIPKQTILDNLKGLCWDECNKWILTAMVEDVAQIEILDNLVNYLKDGQDNHIKWLDKFLFFIGVQNEILLDNYAIVPTQNKIFQKRKGLKRDGGIPEDLKEIARLLRIGEWNDILLFKHPDFTKSQIIIDDNNVENIENIAIEIDKAIRDYDSDKSNNNFIEAVKQLLHRFSSSKTEEFQKLFTYFYDHRAEIVLQTLGDDQARSNIFDVLQVTSQKLDALADLARNPNITEDDLNQFSENIDKFKFIENFKEKLYIIQSDSDRSEEVIEFLKYMGITLSKSLIQETINSSGEISSEEQSFSSATGKNDDGVSSQKEAQKYGQLGEDWARRLYGEFLKYTISNSLDDSGFDLLCSKESERLRVEVKAITYDRPNIRITENEWKKMIEYEESYELLIFAHDQGKPKELIRVKKAWSTLADILSLLQKQPNTSVRYGSHDIESLIGLQLKKDEQGNDVILAWRRLLKNVQHNDVEKYTYIDLSGFKRV
ncbi:sacsin N-terminal ATP-binding-like domain-containing protein [uncultured Nostoc sp.]|uniref:sacsin N-terminal ATP-binding-like domain-containing protein n=1 Tax=uncultured Nostoc sp. TaxID=340711 RepID=UPI0035C9ACAC